jgi:hypothetical protein
LMDLFLRQANTRTHFRSPLGAAVRWVRQPGLGLAGHKPEQGLPVSRMRYLGASPDAPLT